MRNRGYHI